MGLAIEAGGDAADDILIGAELSRRPARTPDLAAENEALHTLARLLIDRPEALPKRLAEIALDLCHAGSAGVSLLEEAPEGTVFRWTALAGQLAPYEGGSTPRDFSPCGLCLDRAEAILVAHPSRRFDYFNDVSAPIIEGLVLPLFGASKRPLGTLWIVAHVCDRQFDREDLRVMTRLADFAALAIECGAAHAGVKASERRSRELLDALPAAVYTTDTAGRITYYNQAAVDLAGRRPELGHDEWCVTWRLYRPDGTPLPHEECPMAVALREDRPVRGEEAVAERPDGTRVPFIPYPTPLHDASGALVGAINMFLDISERKRAEEGLRASEERLRAIFNSTAVGAAILTPAARFIQVNDAFCAITGYSRDELRSLDCGALTHPDHRAHMQELIEGLLAGRTPSFLLEKRYIRKDGALIWVQNSISLTRDKMGQPLHLVALCQDITERKRAEALTDCQRQALQMLAQSAPLEDVLEFLLRMIESHAANGMLGSVLLLDETGTHFRRGIGPSVPQEFNAAVAGVAVSSGLGVCCLAVSRREPVVVPDLSADPQWARFAEFVAPYGLRAAWSTPIVGSAGKVLGTFANYYRRPGDPTPQDLHWVEIVTRTAAIAIERARAEAALRQSRENLTAAMAASDTGTFRWNPHTGEFLEFDDNLKRLFGFAPGDHVRVTEDVITQVHPDDVAALLPAVDACRYGADFSMEYRVVLPDRSIRWLYDRAKMERDSRGKTTYLVGACTDITKRKQAEEALRDLNTRLEQRIAERTRELEAAMAERQKAEAALQQAQRLEAIGQLTGGVAHDFNNLLTVVLGQSERIMAATTDEQIRSRIAAIQRAAERGARLNSQLLAFSRNQELRPERVAIDRLMTNIDDLVRRAVGETIEVEFSADPDLWPTLVDPAQFEAALLNLVINARDAMPEGGRLIIAARNAAVAGIAAMRVDMAPGDYVVVSVTDTGTGMTPHVRKHAFEPFFTTKDVGKGTGLGLAQIYGFARQSGGAAEIKTAVGKGTTVSLYLPRAEAEIGEAPFSTPMRPAEGSGRTVLVVEDQPEVREVIELSLNGLGYQVLTASDGIEARRMLENDAAIDLLLTDIVMPNGISGIDLAKEARRLRRDLKIVLVSGYPRGAQSEAGRGREEFMFLEKPFRQTELGDVIARALNGGSRT